MHGPTDANIKAGHPLVPHDTSKLRTSSAINSGVTLSCTHVRPCILLPETYHPNKMGAPSPEPMMSWQQEQQNKPCSVRVSRLATLPRAEDPSLPPPPGNTTGSAGSAYAQKANRTPKATLVAHHTLGTQTSWHCTRDSAGRFTWNAAKNGMALAVRYENTKIPPVRMNQWKRDLKEWSLNGEVPKNRSCHAIASGTLVSKYAENKLKATLERIAGP